MWGIAPRHIRILCDNPWDGGRGYTPEEVGRMTLDEIIMLLTDKKLLRVTGKTRVTKVAPLSVKPDKDGMARGRAADGTPIRLRVGGKSLAQQVREREAAKVTETPAQRRARERRERADKRAARAAARKSREQ